MLLPGRRRLAMVLCAWTCLVALLFAVSNLSSRPRHVTKVPAVGRPSRRSIKPSAQPVASLRRQRASTPRTTVDVTRLVVAPATTEPSPVSGAELWKAAHVYLPLNEAALKGFKKLEMKQRQRDPSIRDMWSGFPLPRELCLSEVPECVFWRVAKAETVFRKCCTEHFKMKRSLFFALDVAEAAGLKLFLDSGTLLSAMRDGGGSLVPWETDIDLGVVGADPGVVTAAFQDGSLLDAAEAKHRSFYQDARLSSLLPRRHLFEACKTKESKNASRHGKCRDAHYVYWATDASDASHDTSRVEVWPFWRQHGVLVHPTRPKLSVNASLVEPLVFGGRCKMWGRDCWCPRDSEGYLDHEYRGPSWRIPKTIHWSDDNVLPWKTTRPPLPPQS